MISPTGATVTVPEEELGIYEAAGYAVADKSEAVEEPEESEAVEEPEPVKATGKSKK